MNGLKTEEAEDRVSIDRNLLKCLCMDAASVLRKPEEPRRAQMLRGNLAKVDGDVRCLYNGVERKRGQRKEELIKKIYDIEREASRLRNELKDFLKDGEQGTGVTLITETEDGTKYHCYYKSIKGTNSSILTRWDRMEKDGCTEACTVIPLYESIPAEAPKRNLAGYQRLGKSKTYVPQYLGLTRPHLAVARRKRAKIMKNEAKNV